MTKRNLCFAFATLVAAGLYWTPLKALVTFSFHSDIYPYTGVIPLLSACLIYLEKERIFSRVRYDLGIGLVLLFLALVLRWCDKKYSGALSPNDALSLVTFSFIVLWVGVFVLCYGTKTLRAAAFQLSLLLLIVPLPQVVLERSIFFLRTCSTQAAGFLFRLGGVPVFQNEFRFSLPGLDVEVAEQCSGIRSGLSLFITSLLMGHLFLRSPWRRLWLVLAVFPVTIFKNGLRIVTIYWLTVHPSMGSLVVWVHRYGGIPFSILGLSLLTFLVISLRRFEETSTGSWWIISGGAQVREKVADQTLDLTC
jgi:exosortase